MSVSRVYEITGEQTESVKNKILFDMYIGQIFLTSWGLLGTSWWRWSERIDLF